MLQDRFGDCVIKNEFTAAAIDYLNRFSMFKEEDAGYMLVDFYNYWRSLVESKKCDTPVNYIDTPVNYYMNSTEFNCYIFVKYLDSTDNSPYNNHDDDIPAKPLDEQFTLEDAKKFIQAVKPVWESYCDEMQRDVNWVDELVGKLPDVPKGLLSIPSDIC